VLAIDLAFTVLSHPKLDSVRQGRVPRELGVIAPFRLTATRSLFSVCPRRKRWRPDRCCSEQHLVLLFVSANP
jgi:hypothetical protein